MRPKIKPGKIAILVFTIILAFVWIFPFIYMLSTAFKPESETVLWPITIFPKAATVANFQEVLINSDKTPIFRWFFNSMFVAISTTALVVFFDALAAYAYARLKFKGRNFLFWLLMTAMMIPPVTNLIPNYMIVNSLGWVDTYYALIFPAVSSVFGVFLLRQFFQGIPYELEESAIIDGCNRFQIFNKIILPLAKPALITLSLLTFLGAWNDFLWPLVVTNASEMRTLTPGLSLLQGYFVIEHAKLMAGACVSALPALLIFIFAQRYVVQGISLTGIKG